MVVKRRRVDEAYQIHQEDVVNYERGCSFTSAHKDRPDPLCRIRTVLWRR